MAANHKLTNIIKGRTITGTSQQAGNMMISFDDGSMITIKVASSSIHSALIGATVKTVRETSLQLILDFVDGANLTIHLADPGASVGLRAKDNKVEYMG